jgi:ribosomal-protein-alanine N-acetyltransferase
MRSLNPVWRLDDFHGRIAQLAEVGAGQHVLDLGCGNGNGLDALITRVGPTGRVVALDRDAASLARAAAREGPLTTIEADIAAPLPLDSESFDAVICQNVIECVTDRAGLLREIHRVLRPGGRALVGHHDFDGVLLASDDKTLTRQLVHGYADHAQSWQDVAEGQMGRLLPGLFAGGPFADTCTETLLFVDRVLAEGTYARQHLGDIVQLGPHYGVPAEAAERWFAGLRARSKAGAFYYALPWTYVLARRRTTGVFPELSTPRLRLRALTEADAPAYRSLLHLPDVTRFTNLPLAPGEAQALRDVRAMIELFPAGTGCAWAIEETASGAFVGVIRFNYFQRWARCGGIGYESHPDFWGRGLITEAVRAVVQCGHGRFDLNRIEAWTVPGNPGSDRVLEKAGLRLEGVQRQKAFFHDELRDCRLFGRLAADPS